jgi:hypothetical protein
MDQPVRSRRRWTSTRIPAAIVTAAATAAMTMALAVPSHAATATRPNTANTQAPGPHCPDQAPPAGAYLSTSVRDGVYYDLYLLPSANPLIPRFATVRCNQ